jgi:hypothetical protein
VGKSLFAEDLSDPAEGGQPDSVQGIIAGKISTKLNNLALFR